MSKEKSLSYESSGVNITVGSQLVDLIKPLAQSTQRPEVLGGIGGFAGYCALPTGYKEPVLVGCTDGVGTKLRLAVAENNNRGIGIDLVAMCANDLVTCGAEPLFFLDYYACGKLELAVASEVIAGIADGCQLSGMALLGGETAEMPGHYAHRDYDVAGFCVGVVEKERLLNNPPVAEGDVILGLASSGIHSNGYSLVRKIIEEYEVSLDMELDGVRLGDLLLTPTRIYVKPILELFEKCEIHGCAHITGGGLTENVPRVFKDYLCAVIKRGSWPIPTIFTWMQERANLSEAELFRTFNCGIGMAIIAPEAEKQKIMEILEPYQIGVYEIGRMERAFPNQSNLVFVG